MWFPKFPYTNFSQINLDWVLRQIKELSEWMNRYFKQIRQDLDDEINNRIEGDKALGERIDQEITDRTEADQQLQDNIDAEEAAREAADTALGGRIDKEIQDRTEADTALGARIDQEIQDRTNADTALGQRIDAEEAAREAADTALGQRIDTETSERKAADQQLQSNIDALRSDAILKDGSTTTTAAIPFAQGVKTGSITELYPDAGVGIEAQLDMNSHKITALANGTDNTDAVNVGQLEAFAADVHSIPAGGSSGQVLAKVDGTNYNVTWVDQQGGGSGGDVPAGGATGQVLAKATDADYQTEWVNQPEGLPAGGTTGQVVTKTDSGAEWANAPSGLPAGGTTGQVVTKTDDGAEWAAPPGFQLIETVNGVELWSDGEFAFLHITKNLTTNGSATPQKVGDTGFYYAKTGSLTFIPNIKFSKSYYYPSNTSAKILQDTTLTSSRISYEEFYIDTNGTVYGYGSEYGLTDSARYIYIGLNVDDTTGLYKIGKQSS